MKLTFYTSIDTDVLIVGAGYAGIKSTLECCKAGLKVLLVVKNKVCSGSSFYPFMGACASLVPKDDGDKELFLKELEDSGAGMSDRHLSEIYIDEIRDRVKEFDEIGFNARMLSGIKACFSKRERDIVYWDDFAGNSNNIVNTFKKFPNLTIMEATDVIHILKKDNMIVGAIASDLSSKLTHIKTNNIILATGGFCGLYEHNLNTNETLGLGQAMALEAGAKLINLEFVQFIPGILSPVYKAPFHQLSLLYCESVLDFNGKEILSEYLPKDLSIRECLRIRSGHGPFTFMNNSKYFDIAMFRNIVEKGNKNGCQLLYSSQIAKTKNEPIKLYLSYLKDMSIDVLEDKIMIAPFGHAANGGILINENGETSVKGLFAAGEVSGGLHGADRVGGLASGSCFVFGKRAALSVIRRKQQNSFTSHISDYDALKQFKIMLDTQSKGELSPQEVMLNIKSILYKYASIIRTEVGLKTGLELIRNIETSYSPMVSIKNGSSVLNAAGAHHSLMMAKILLTVMKERKESRGAHYRNDFPYTDDERYKERILVSFSGNSYNLEYI